MLEASIIIVMVLMLLMAMLSITFMLYQQAVITSVANDIAADIAENYKYAHFKIGDTVPEDAEFKAAATGDDMLLYRTTFYSANLKKKHEDNDALEADAQKWLDKTSFGINEEPVEVECRIHTSGIGRAYVTVTVSQKTEFFLSGVLEAMGIADKKMKFSATAYAECIDILGYTSTVNLAQFVTGELDAYQSVGKFYNNFDGLWQKVKGLLGIK